MNAALSRYLLTLLKKPIYYETVILIFMLALSVTILPITIINLLSCFTYKIFVE